MTGNVSKLREGVMELRADIRRLEAPNDPLADVIRAARTKPRKERVKRVRYRVLSVLMVLAVLALIY